MSEQQKPKYPPPFALSSLPSHLPQTATKHVENESTSITESVVTGTIPSEMSLQPGRTSKRPKNDASAILADATHSNTMDLYHPNLTPPLDGTGPTTTISPLHAVSSKGITIAQKSIHKTDRNSNIDKDCQKLPGRDLNDKNIESNSDPNNISADGSQQQDVDSDNESENTVVDILSTYLTEVLIIKIMNFCSVSDLVHGIGMVNNYYYAISYLDTVGWERYYTKNILEEKCLIRLPPIPANKDSTNKRILYQYAVLDSHRQCITMEELCYDISGTIWRFRFKSAAGTDWTSADPWHSGQASRKMLFFQNGTIMMARIRLKGEGSTTAESTSAPPNHPVPPKLSFVSRSSIINDDEELLVIPPPLQMTWRFLTRPMDLPTRHIGGYIRIHVGNRDVPTYTCIRSPTNNWGFVFESCWGVYANFDLPVKRTSNTPMIANDVTATAGPTMNRQPPERQGMEHDINTWFHTNTGPMNIANMDEAVDRHAQEQPLPVVPQIPPSSASATLASNVMDMQDDTMLLTNEVQWREAFLYNVGVRILPEGDEAAYEFDRFWQNNGYMDANNNNNNRNDNNPEGNNTDNNNNI